MSDLFTDIQESVAAIRTRSDFIPDIGIILGTGLGRLADRVDKSAEISYTDIPHFPVSTVESHAGKLILGKLSGKRVVVMQGRFHYYEGYSLQQVVYPVRVMKALGVRTLIVSNACGGLNPSFAPGDIMIITDHINLLGQTPLIGRNDHRIGPRFPDMYDTYSTDLRQKALKAALEKKIPVKQGVYAVMSGPCLETAAEYRMLKIMGADVIGMSTVPEVIAAVHAGLEVLGLSVITDKCDPDNLKPVKIDEIIATANKTEPRLIFLVEGVLEHVQ
ncbi:MAG: purine-nucleoside phosphorylase [Elusimicrobia bacterium RIFOXYB2_FULL_49_7]|nr:MAG: purine-nucleoside phosphorylase [Elusimicrobia bacterium RIFOXYB2_FULL_49_7]